MKLPRRTFLHLTAGAAAMPAVSRIGRGLLDASVFMMIACSGSALVG
jgi:hypothetical protein